MLDNGKILYIENDSFYFLSCFFFRLLFIRMFLHMKKDPIQCITTIVIVECFFIQFCIALFINIHQKYNILIHRFGQAHT